MRGGSRCLVTYTHAHTSQLLALSPSLSETKTAHANKRVLIHRPPCLSCEMPITLSVFPLSCTILALSGHSLVHSPCLSLVRGTRYFASTHPSPIRFSPFRNRTLPYLSELGDNSYFKQFRKAESR